MHWLSLKHWPADLAVTEASPALGGYLFNPKQGPIAHSLSLSPTHHPDMTEIFWKGRENPSIAFHKRGGGGGGGGGGGRSNI